MGRKKRAKKKTAYRYRDKKTKKFVSESTFRRSRAQGGTKFQRETVHARARASSTKRLGKTRPVAQSSASQTSGSGQASNAVKPRSKKIISTLREFYDGEDYDYAATEFDTGIDYGEG